jgi:type II secretory pathway pseudopilin PulG
VVITIIGILIALLLPAVQAAREAARRMQCGNNLKQVGLALQLYHEQKTAFPIGIAYDPTGNYWVTWLQSSLPYLEAENVGRSYNPTGWLTGANATIYRTKIATYNCPSDDADREGRIDKLFNPSDFVGFSRSNVVGCFSPDAGVNEASSSGKHALFAIGKAFSIAQVTDGTSNTVAFSEMIAGPNGSSDARGMWWDDYGCHYEHRYNPNSRTDSMWNFVSSYGYCVATKVYCDCNANAWGTTVFAASSAHPGGVDVALVDGSVRFANDTINNAVWQALGSIDGGGRNSEETSPDF